MSDFRPFRHSSLRSLKILETYFESFSPFSPCELRRVVASSRACEIFKRPQGRVPKGTKARLGAERCPRENPKRNRRLEMNATAIHILKDGKIVAQIVVPEHIKPLALNTSEGYESSVWQLVKPSEN